MANFLLDTVVLAIQSSTSKVEIVTSRKTILNPWMTKDTKKLQKKRRNLVRAKKHGTTTSLNTALKDINDKIMRSNQQDRASFFDKKFDDSMDRSKLWKNLNSLRGKQKAEMNEINLLTDDMRLISEQKAVANHFNSCWLDNILQDFFVVNLYRFHRYF